MNLPGIRYEVYCFIGRRLGGRGGVNKDLPIGTELGDDCYRFKIFDSASGDNPLILNPIHDIKENTAGTLSFVLFRNSKGTVYFRKASDTNELSYPQVVNLRSFMLIKQTEFVIFRHELKNISNSEAWSTKELWAGRISSITKDFYGDWTISVEGEMSYLNDVSVDYERITQKKKTPAANILFRNFISLHNEGITKNESLMSGGVKLCRINTSQEASGIPRLGSEESPLNPQSVMPIDRYFVLSSTGYADAFAEDKTNQYINKTKANLEDGYTVTEGSAWTNLQIIIDRYGGHLVIKKKIEDGKIKRYIYWKQSGTVADPCAGYNTASNGDPKQKIFFSKNLLNYTEEKNGDSLFTVLVPHGNAKEIETTDANGNKKTTLGKPIDITGYGTNNTKYIYDSKYVKKYGFIEKIETWSISDPKTLANIAQKYYQDCRIDAVKISISAYDLKNLLCTPTDQDKRSVYLAADALYLYDVVQIAVENPEDQSYINNYHTQKIPIQGIRIPFDKFPTDTEYTISNDHAKRGILQPGALGSKEPENTKPENKDGTDPEPEKIEEKKEIVRPIGWELGLDNDITRHPIIHLDRSFDYIQGPISFRETKVDEATGTSSYGRYITELGGNISIDNPYAADILGAASYGSSNTILTAQKDVELRGHAYSRGTLPYTASAMPADYKNSALLGYKKEDAVFIDGAQISYTGINNALYNVFYTDDYDDNNKLMRRHKQNDIEESLNNWFERVYKTEHDNVDLTLYVDGYMPYYKSDAQIANLNPGEQSWVNMCGKGHFKAPDIEFSEPIEITGEGSVETNQILNNIKALEVLGTSVNAILTSSNVDVELDVMQSSYFDINMKYEDGTQSADIKTLAYRYRPDSLENGTYVYRIGKLEIGDTAMIYYIYYKKEEPELYDGIDNLPDNIANKISLSEIVKYGYGSAYSNVSINIEGKPWQPTDIEAAKKDPLIAMGNKTLAEYAPQPIWHYWANVHDNVFNVDYIIPLGRWSRSNGELGGIFYVNAEYWSYIHDNTNYVVTPNMASAWDALISSGQLIYDVNNGWLDPGENTPGFSIPDTYATLVYKKVRNAAYLSYPQIDPDTGNMRYPTREMVDSYIDNFWSTSTGHNLLGRYMEAKGKYQVAKEKLMLRDVAKEYGMKQNYADAYANARPLLVLTKNKRYGESATSESYGVIPIQHDGAAMTIQFNADGNYYTFAGGHVNHISNIGSYSSGAPFQPVLLTSNTLKDGTHYLFKLENETLSVTNANPVPYYPMRDAPLTMLVRCGGLQTRDVANNAFMRLCGNPESAYPSARQCISPIPFESAVKSSTRNEVQSTPASGSTPPKKWYYGSDMLRIEDVEDVTITEIPKTTSVEDTFADRTSDMGLFNLNTLGRQPVIIGPYGYIQVTPSLFIRLPGQETPEEQEEQQEQEE